MGGADRQLDGSTKLAAKYPAIWEFLTLSIWEDGEPRVPGSITVFLQDGFLKACLIDKDADLVAFVSADSLEGILQALEAGIQDERMDWRRPREKGGGRPRK